MTTTTTVAEPVRVEEITVAEQPEEPCGVDDCPSPAEYVAVFAPACPHSRILLCPVHKLKMEEADARNSSWKCTICITWLRLKGIWRIR